MPFQVQRILFKTLTVEVKLFRFVFEQFVFKVS